jgi:hypothetical protein
MKFPGFGGFQDGGVCQERQVCSRVGSNRQSAWRCYGYGQSAVCCLCVKNSNIQDAVDVLSELEQKLEDSGEGGP